MESNHMMEIVQNLIEYVLCQVKYDKGLARERLADMGWSDAELEYFDAEYMFKEDDEE